MADHRPDDVRDARCGHLIAEKATSHLEGFLFLADRLNHVIGACCVLMLDGDLGAGSDETWLWSGGGGQGLGEGHLVSW